MAGRPKRRAREGRPTAPAPDYHVYVIELDETQRREGDKGAVYVGQSVRTPEERFAQHLEGHRAARVVRNHGRHLRKRLYQRFNPLASRAEAERQERELAARLRARGYTVYGGH
jgi:hypothetical protein